MVVAAVVFHLLCPSELIKLPCSDGVLDMSYGWCFWSNLVIGKPYITFTLQTYCILQLV